MSIKAIFTDRRSLPAIADPYRLWTYQIEFSPDSEPPAGDLLALAFPGNLDIKDPGSFSTVPELAGMFLMKDATASRQYVGRAIAGSSAQTLSFVANDGEAPCEILVVTNPAGELWSASLFSTDAAALPALTQQLTGPAPAPPIPVPGPRGRPLADFTGTLPYASEIFGVYQPLAGWLGQRSTQRNSGSFLRNGRSTPLQRLFSAWQTRLGSSTAVQPVPADSNQAVLSPVGLVSLFREYFFEFDNFLGAPSGHIWISPGGTVEVVESSTRHTLIEKTSEQSDQSNYKVEEALTNQDDVADAVKEDNANDTKLGASASAGAKFAGIYQADASASFSNQTTTHKSSEVTHKHTRTQSARVSSEIQRNFKTTFKTVSETTDITSRRYVVQNTTQKLVNYELRRKMRKVGVQVQHIGSRLSWQVFLDSPGTDLGMGELVHVVEAPDISSLKKPEQPPPLQPKDLDFTANFTLQKYPGTANDPHQDANYTRSGETPGVVTGMHSDNNDDQIVGDFAYTAAPPAPGYTIGSIRLTAAKTGGGDAQFLVHFAIPANSPGGFTLKADFLNFGGGRIITFTVSITWNPPAVDPAQAQYQAALADYNAQVADLQHKAYGNAVRERMKLVSSMRRRSSEDLRKEERQTVYGKLIRDLELIADPHVDSELIRQIFDVDEMLYFAAPDYWRPGPATVPPRSASSVGRYPVPAPPVSGGVPGGDPLDGETVASWYSHTEFDNSLDPSGAASREYRIDYLVTEETQPAPFGSSLGWLIQIDADDRRNEFLNAAWVKAVLPIRPGHELEALDWLAQANVEGEAGLDQPYPVQPGDPAEYQGKTLGQVLQLLATDLQMANTDIQNTLATEKVFETGFDPLESGFRPAEPYQIFDQWIEVLPTDQIVAVQVEYDPVTGKLM